MANTEHTTAASLRLNRSGSKQDGGYLTRREVIVGAAVGVGGLAIVGCGGSSSTRATSTTGQTKPKRGGAYRHGNSDSSTSDSLDPNAGESTYTTQALDFALYDTLTRPVYPELRVENHLAELLEPATDLTYWDVRLHDAEFHNGKPVTADDVIYSIQRFMNTKAGGNGASVVPSVDPKRLKKMDAKTVRIYLVRPDRTIPLGLWHPTTSIVPVGYDPHKPVGSGPFTLKSFAPGRETVFVRNPNYWRSGLPYLDELHFVGFADPGTTRMNALTAGQIDGADGIPTTLVRTIEGNASIQVLTTRSDSYNVFAMKVDTPPFTDPRVRTAMALIPDRQQIVEQVFAGAQFATLGNDLPNPADPIYDHSIPQRHQDIEQAKSLLKQAGQSDLRVTHHCANFAPGIIEAAQVLKQNALAAGVTINVDVSSDLATYFSKYYYSASFKADYDSPVPIFNMIFWTYVPGGVFNIGNYNNPRFTSLVHQAIGEPDEAKVKAIMAEAQQIMHADVPQIIPAFYYNLNAHSTKFTGFAPKNVWGGGPQRMHFDEIGLA